MSSNFECFVQINDNKYNISINQCIDSTSFQSLYPKIKEIVKIAENVDIDLKTHDFVIIDEKSLTGKQMDNTSQMVKQMSMIYITPKLIHFPIVASELSSVLTPTKAKQIPRTHENPEEILEYEADIRLYHSIILVIDIDMDLKRYTSDWDLIRSRLNKNGFKYSANYLVDCFYRCTEYYGKNYHKFNGKMSPKSQSIFDLLKVIHTLDVCLINNCPFRRKLQSIEKSQEHIQYFQKHLKPIKDKKLSKSNPNEDNVKNKREEIIGIRAEDYLKQNQIEVKDYYSIVITIDCIPDFRGTYDNWSKVYNRVKVIDNSYIWKTCVKMVSFFYEWTEYYAQNYDKIDRNLSPESQKIFDLLKVVHILDLNCIFDSSNTTSLKIKEISERKEFKQFYLKIMFKVMEYKKQNQLSNDCPYKSKLQSYQYSSDTNERRDTVNAFNNLFKTKKSRYY